MKKRETEGYPLNGREVKLPDAEESRRAEGKHRADENRARPGKPELAPENVREPSREEAREQEDRVHGENEIPRTPDDWGGEKRASDLVLGVSEGARLGVKDVRIEDVEGCRRERMDVPAEGPEEKPRVGTEVERDRAHSRAERKGEYEREEEKESRGPYETHGAEANTAPS